ncbi:glutamine-hydrolyzing GMP synthase [Candidatus Micrarchaeota archaeon CG10_big_fil_rev_8_21_14_0_10_45_29]|nr:MAG: glutamine-hydrolyzing GMP synthase [Candidatus Micrarchaeota archaeon CG10_big_fil_rev_8_21_14_0_10_45_29]QBM01553.1 GMP synthase [glutamine-hydrolyzing] [uncultured archaeon]
MAFDKKKFIEEQISLAKQKIGDKPALLGLSGGVDSSVAALIVYKAIGKNLHPVFVDTGLMRLDEAKHVKSIFDKLKMKIEVIDASEEFFTALKGVSEPEKKRKIIGEKFIRVFEKYAKTHGIKVLVQGTIAPDWIESGGQGRDTIKSHHNVGGLPEKMGLELFEPLRDCYKHEVRILAQELKLPDEISKRQPFPGPGLAVRIVGEITKEKAQIVRKCCHIVEEELEKASAKKEIEHPWQYFAALLPSKTVGVRGDERSYQYTIVVRAVRSLDGMTANFSHLPPKLLEKISSRITNEVSDVGRVLYDITNKPPATVELE